MRSRDQAARGRVSMPAAARPGRAVARQPTRSESASPLFHPLERLGRLRAQRAVGGSDREILLVLLRGEVAVALLLVDFAEMIVGVGQARINADRLLERLLGLLG